MTTRAPAAPSRCEHRGPAHSALKSTTSRSLTDRRVVGAGFLVAAADRLPQVVPTLLLFARVVAHHQAVFGQVVEQRAEIRVVVSGEALEPIVEQEVPAGVGEARGGREAARVGEA